MDLRPFALSGLLCTAAGPGVGATFPAAFEPRRMTPDEGLLFTAAGAATTLGTQAVALGDIDGDGHVDLALATNPYSAGPGTYLLYGGPSLTSMALDPTSVAAIGGVHLDGRRTVRAIGDFDGDGLDDWLSTGPESGATIVLGRRERHASPLNLGTLPDGTSARITLAGAPLATDRPRVSALGDIDGDGRDDLGLTAPDEPDHAASTLTVLRGRAAPLPAALDLSREPASARSRLRVPIGVDGGGYLWSALYGDVRAAGDVDGDGRADLLIAGGGLAYTVFGAVGGLPPLIDVETLDGTNGQVLLAHDPAADPSGRSAVLRSALFDHHSRFVEDLDGDGIDDLSFTVRDDTTYTDRTGVLFGSADASPATLNLLELPESRGLLIDGPTLTRGPAGDLNGDGIDDAFVQGADGVHIDYGDADPLGALRVGPADGVAGFLLAPTLEADGNFIAFGTGGDVNGDGIDDFLMAQPASHAPDVDIDTLLDAPHADGFGARRTGLVAVVFGRREVGAPASPSGAHPAYSPDSLEVRWTLPAAAAGAAVELTRDGAFVATIDAPGSAHDDTVVSRATRHTYELVTVSATGARSAPLVLSANNDLERYPELGGEVWSDSLAELFWVFDDLPYDVFRDGAPVDRVRGQSWLDTAWDGRERTYRIELDRRRFDDHVVRSGVLRLPTQTGTSPPAAPTGPRFELYSESTLELFWTAAERGTPPLRYEISKDREPLAIVSGTSLMDADVGSGGVVDYTLTTIDGNGRRSVPVPFFVSVHDALPAIRPAQAENLSGTVLSASSLELAWEPSATGTPATGYEVRRQGRVIGRTAGTRFTDTGLAPDTRHGYEVIAFDDAGRRSRSAHLYAPATLGGPLAPSDASAIAHGPRTVELFWSRAEGGATFVPRYAVYRDGERIATIEGTSYLDDALTPGTVYAYAVRSVSTGGALSDRSAGTTVATRER